MSAPPLRGNGARAGSRGGKAAGELASHAPAPAPSAQSRRLNADAGTLSPLPGLRLFLRFCQGEPGELGAARCRGGSVPPPSGDTVGSCFESRVKNYTRLRPHVLRLPLHCPRLASRFLPAPDGHSRLLRPIAARQNDCPRRRGRELRSRLRLECAADAIAEVNCPRVFYTRPHCADSGATQLPSWSPHSSEGGGGGGEGLDRAQVNIESGSSACLAEKESGGSWVIRRAGASLCGSGI